MIVQAFSKISLVHGPPDDNERRGQRLNYLVLSMRLHSFKMTFALSSFSSHRRNLHVKITPFMIRSRCSFR